MKMIAFYHLYLTDDPAIWTSIFMEQMRCIEYSGLGDKLERIYLRCITQEDIRVRTLTELVKKYPTPFVIDYKTNMYRNDYHMIFNHNSDEIYTSGQTESVSLKGVYDYSMSEDAYILYMHSKAVSSHIHNISPGYILEHRDNVAARNLLNWGTIERWRDCVAALEEYDTAGISYTNKVIPFYAGNFWWTKSSHVRRLLDPMSPEWNYLWQQINDILGRQYHNRCGDEMWLCAHPDTKSYDILDGLSINEFESMPPFVRERLFTQ